MKKNFRSFLKEHHNMDSNDESSMLTNQLKNIMKNAQSMLNIISTGQQIDAWVQSHIAVSDSKIQDVKNYMENESTEKTSVDKGGSMEPQILNPVPVENELTSTTMDADDILPEPFPEEEIEDDGQFNVKSVGDVNVLEVEPRYEKSNMKSNDFEQEDDDLDFNMLMDMGDDEDEDEDEYDEREFKLEK